MKIFPNAFHKLFCSPLMIHPAARESLESGLLSHMGYRAGPGDPGRPIQDYIDFEKDWKATEEAGRIEDVYKKFRNVAVVKIHGVIDKMVTRFEMQCYGGCDLADVDKALALAANDPQINTIVLDIHSPGGSVTGTPETAARIAEIAKTKEVHAYTSTQICSAAYYIASQADYIAAAPSAIIGSIGVYMAVIDRTRELEMDGIKVELIKSGRLKAMGASFKSLTDEEREYLQKQCDAIYTDFKAACLTHRVIDDSVMQGQCFRGEECVANGLINATTADNIDEYVARLIR